MFNFDDIKEYITNLLQERFGLATAVAVTAASAVLLYLTSSGPKALEYPIPLEQQSVEVEPGVRGSCLVPNGTIIQSYYEDATTTYEAFIRGVKISNDKPFLGTRTGPNKSYEWITYQEVYDKVQRLGSAFIQKGVVPGAETFIGIYAPNCPQWVVAMEACGMYSMTYVPLYDTLGAEACSYIINQTSMSMVICDTEKKLQMILDTIDNTPSLKTAVVLQPISNELRVLAKEKGIDVSTYDEMIELGERNLRAPVPPKPDSTATICYTSGTTGNPKGVMLSHGNLVSNTAGLLTMLRVEITHDDVHISYLPLAHMFERLVQLLVVQHGARIGFFGGDVRGLMDDLQTLRPTIFATVPRLLNRIYDKVLMGVQGSKIKSALFNLALSRKMELAKKGIFTRDSVWDKLVFGKVQKLMGGRVRFSVVGSAPLAANVLNFTRCAFGCMVLEGYGQTEATAGVTLTAPNEHVAGMVGAPIPCNHIKLIDVPEMEYWARDGKGEVCVRGANVMKGYYKEPEKTAETVTKDGWLMTGDIGMWLPNGTLRIIDRRKHIFKLAQGEYLAPEKIEGVYLRSPLVAQCFVDGNSLQTYAVAVIVPDPEVLPKWAAKNGYSGNVEQLSQNSEVKKAILEDINKKGKEAGLKSFEQAKQIHVHAELFSVENGLLTPTFKSKRPALRKHFAQQIEDMYNN